MAKSKPPARHGVKGYVEGGSVGGSILSGMRNVMAMASLAKTLKGTGASPDAPGAPDKTGDNANPGDPGSPLGEVYNRGGKIRSTSGPKIGKDDGLIPAQRGEYVVRKSAVKKLGPKVMGQINKGHLPRKGAR